MKKLLQISLGIVTSVGGFIETGQIATSAQAGAAYGFSLLWAIAIGTVCLIFLIEMAGRFAIASHHTVADGMRERFGSNYFLLTLLIVSIVNLLVLASEIGGVTLALQFVTGVGYQWWALPVAFIVWLLLWKGTFGMIEDGVAMLGLVALCFVVGVFVMDPPWLEVAKGLVPTLPDKQPLHYGFIAVSILGAVIAPFLFLFYSSGAIEEKWDKSFFGANRVISALGMSFGAVIAAAILIVAALAYPPRGITDIEGYDQIAPILTPALGKWGFYLFAASLGITCLGAALEASLGQAYLVAQGFGWNWSEDAKPRTDPAFSLVYTGFIAVAFMPIAIGVDPLQLTIFSMAITALALPFGVVPFLFLMNDRNYVGDHGNGWISNTAVLVIIGLSFIVALITIPLQIFGG
ncbi:Nramp family divalent metal transporter [Rhizobium leguminosarum]|uniref:Nramp family divalent metal transporter n=1 Tax=Rhizobium leguminosarum TaxID=384 RepID=UPI001C96914C|nr:Nramp family divalent metal transporter [Rhizobium leguminosarum]MBY5337257.1 Nramp family divalent metal transporter [Rhizobium leguminosarum]MBY5412536.1 Nramp family divalent metal transporter [Rhizobium leguminosarum]